MSIRNNKYHRDYQRKQYAERMRWAIGLLGGKCAACGEVSGLQFDHVNKNTKSFTISDRMACASKEILLAELAKCQLLCVPCHARKTASECGHVLRADRPPTPPKPPREPVVLRHGSLVAYKYHGCRCDICTAATTLYQREYRRRASCS